MNLKVEPFDLDSSVQVLHLRLTDACLNALEQNAGNSSLNLEIKANSPSSGIIQFKNNTGQILKEFNVAYSEENKSKDTPLQLVRLKSKLGVAEDLGTLCKKLTVNANDEVFEDYSKKITALEENSKQKSAKELKPINQNQQAKQVMKAKRLIGTSAIQNSVINKIKGSLNSNKSNHHMPIQQIKPGIESQNALKNRQVPARDFTSIPIYKRIIQTIAIRPYRRSDLVTRFTLEGLSNQDKQKIDSILQQVTSQVDGNKEPNAKILLTLKSEFLKSVDPSWPLYTPVEKQLVVRNLEKIKLDGTSQQHVSSKDNSAIAKKHEKLEVQNASEKLKPVANNLTSNNTSDSALSSTYSDKSASTSKKPKNPSLKQISQTDYNKYVTEYNSIYPTYEKLYNHIIKIKEQYKGYRKKAIELSESKVGDGIYADEDEIEAKLIELRHRVETENECLGVKLTQDIEKQKKLHNRILFLKGAIKSYVRSKNASESC